MLTEEKVVETLALVAAQGDPQEGESGLLPGYAARLLVEPNQVPALTVFRGRVGRIAIAMFLGALQPEDTTQQPQQQERGS